MCFLLWASSERSLHPGPVWSLWCVRSYNIGRRTDDSLFAAAHTEAHLFPSTGIYAERVRNPREPHVPYNFFGKGLSEGKKTSVSSRLISVCRVLRAAYNFCKRYWAPVGQPAKRKAIVGLLPGDADMIFHNKITFIIWYWFHSIKERWQMMDNDDVLDQRQQYI